MPINPPAPHYNSFTKEDEKGPLSEPPSPFLSKEIYLECHRNGIEQALVARQREALETSALLKKVKIEMDKIGSDISSSEDELLTGERMENNYSPIERQSDVNMDVKSDKDDDQMSLSSLSSNDQKIEESKMETGPAPTHRIDIPPPLTTAFHNPYQPHYPGELLNFIWVIYGVGIE